MAAARGAEGRGYFINLAKPLEPAHRVERLRRVHSTHRHHHAFTYIDTLPRFTPLPACLESGATAAPGSTTSQSYGRSPPADRLQVAQTAADSRQSRPRPTFVRAGGQMHHLLSNLERCKVEAVASTMVGFALGVFGSWIFWKYLLWVKPSVELSKNVSVSTDSNTGEKTYRVKIINVGRNQVIDISLKAWVVTLMELHGGKVSTAVYEMPVRNSPTMTLNPEKQVKRPWGITSEAYIRSTPDEDIERMLEEKNTKLMVTFRASDALSGSTVVQQVVYSRADIVPGMFKMGRSFDIMSMPTGLERKGEVEKQGGVQDRGLPT